MRFRLEILALGAWATAIAGFLAVDDVARHVIPQLGVASFVVGLLCLWRRVWGSGALWTATALIALWPVLPNYVPYHETPGAGCRVDVVTFNHLEGTPDNAGAARLLAGLHPDIVFAQKVYDTEAFRGALVSAGFGGFDSFASSGNSQLILS